VIHSRLVDLFFTTNIYPNPFHNRGEGEREREREECMATARGKVSVRAMGGVGRESEAGWRESEVGGKRVRQEGLGLGFAHYYFFN